MNYNLSEHTKLPLPQALHGEELYPHPA